MTSEGVRRSDRVALTLVLEASGHDVNGEQFQELARTLLINRHGAVVVLDRELAPEQRIHLAALAESDRRKEQTYDDGTG